jgi:viroplasmin and RNaseH domain-containing protein
MLVPEPEPEPKPAPECARRKPLSTYKFYAVARGRTVAVFNSWTDCVASVQGYINPKYRGFNDYAAAKDWLAMNLVRDRCASK